jgi:hypothetical protein
VKAHLRAVIAAGALAAIALAQADPGAAPQPAASTGGDAAAAATDWSKEVARACTSPRYGLRLAASKKIAAGGDDAVPAVRVFVKEHGKDALPVALVEAIADGGGDGEAVLALLEEWAQDREFFWRGQAMRGLIPRLTNHARFDRLGRLFDAHWNDPAWLVRAHARAGLQSTWLRDNVSFHSPRDLRDSDPRANTRIAALTKGDKDLVEALGDERTFLGDPWGKRRATEAFQALQRFYSKDWGYRPEADFAANEAAIAAIAKELGAPVPAHLVDPDIHFVGGIEILSCRNGDVFVAWTADGRVAGSTTPVLGAPLQLDRERWPQLSTAATALALPPQSGVVICDKMRIVPGAGLAQAAVAPGALPAAAADWLKQFATAIEEAGGPDLGRALRDRLPQFTVR